MELTSDDIMTEKEYASAGGKICPRKDCKSPDVVFGSGDDSGYSEDYTDEKVHREFYRCNACGSKWWQTFLLVGYRWFSGEKRTDDGVEPNKGYTESEIKVITST